MITIIERDGGWTIGVPDDRNPDAHYGQVLHVTDAEAEELRAALTNALRPVDTAAVSPAKAYARMRPPIQRYPVRAAR